MRYLPVFANEPSEWERMDWRLLQNGFVTLYCKSEVLAKDVGVLAGDGYSVVDLDASEWATTEDALVAVGRAFSFPDYYGRNFNTLSDCLGDVASFDYGADSDATGTATVLRRFDRFVERQPESAHSLLDTFARTGRAALLIGHRMVFLVQSDNPDLQLAAVDAVAVMWNNAEFQRSRRT
jgi:Barstar (barnase inhibitor)